MAVGERILIVGGDSRIGRGLAARHLAAGDLVTRTLRRPAQAAGEITFELGRRDATPLPGTYDIAYVCAAATGLAHCEAHPRETAAVNVAATFDLIRHLAARGTFVVFFSTNLVFDGTQPWVTPGATVNPRCEYGRQKAGVEALVLGYRLPAAVIRLTKVIDETDPLFRDWVGALRDGRAITPFSDKVMAPVSHDLTVSLAVTIARRRRAGLAQVSAASDISYAEAARFLVRRLGRPASLVQPRPCPADAVSTPRFTSLAVAPDLFPGGAPDPFAALDGLNPLPALAA